MYTHPLHHTYFRQYIMKCLLKVNQKMCIKITSVIFHFQGLTFTRYTDALTKKRGPCYATYTEESTGPQPDSKFTDTTQVLISLTFTINHVEQNVMIRLVTFTINTLILRTLQTLPPYK